MKLTHILLLLAVTAIAVAAWRLSQSDESNRESVGGVPAATTTAAGANTAGLAPVAAPGGGTVEPTRTAERVQPAPAASAFAPGSAQVTSSDNLATAADSSVSAGIVAGGLDFSAKYEGVDEAGRRSSYESLERRITLSKGLSEKEGGFSEEGLDRAIREMQWLQDNLQP